MRETSAARFYELMVITAPDGTPEELVETVEQINGYITNAGGSILRTNYDSPWGRRRLAYPIRHHSQDVRDGFYSLIHMEVDPDKVIDIERDLKLNDRLMRYLVLQLASEPVFPEPEPEGEEGEAGESTGADGEAPETTTGQPAEASEATAADRRSESTSSTETPSAAESTAQAEAAESNPGEQITPVADEAKEESDVTE